jgi:hypothetical protein
MLKTLLFVFFLIVSLITINPLKVSNKLKLNTKTSLEVSNKLKLNTKTSLEGLLKLSNKAKTSDDSYDTPDDSYTESDTNYSETPKPEVDQLIEKNNDETNGIN